MSLHARASGRGQRFVAPPHPTSSPRSSAKTPVPRRTPRHCDSRAEHDWDIVLSRRPMQNLCAPWHRGRMGIAPKQSAMSPFFRSRTSGRTERAVSTERSRCPAILNPPTTSAPLLPRPADLTVKPHSWFRHTTRRASVGYGASPRSGRRPGYCSSRRANSAPSGADITSKCVCWNVHSHEAAATSFPSFATTHVPARQSEPPGGGPPG